MERFFHNVCLRNPALVKDGLSFSGGAQTCLSKGSIPVQPYIVLGGFIPEGFTGFPSNPDYLDSDAVIITMLVNNYDPYSEDPLVQKRLDEAKEWEKTFLDFMKTWQGHPHMEVAFYSERSIEDELKRESSGDVTTIAISYLIMFFYVTISLGTFTTWKRVMVSLYLFSCQ